MLIWNNEEITIRNKSLFFPRWVNNGIQNIISLFDSSGNILSYEQFLSHHCFPVPFREFNLLIKAIPNGLIQLIKNHLSHGSLSVLQYNLCLEGVDLVDKKCNNKHIRQMLQSRKTITPRGKFYWTSFVQDINWKKTWLLPSKYCITNKVKEVNFKILHKIYPVNEVISKYADIQSDCTFCGSVDETLIHLFFECQMTKLFLNDLNKYLFEHLDIDYSLSMKDFFFYYENPENKSLEFVVNFFVLQAKFFIHKQKWQKLQPSFSLFSLEMDTLIKSLHIVKDNSKNDRLLCLLNTASNR